MEREVVDACLARDLQRAKRLLGAEIPDDLLDEMTALRYAQAELAAAPRYQPWSARALVLT